MATDPIPDEVRDLLSERIETFEHLEVALLFGRDPNVARKADAIATDLHLPTAVVDDTLDRFASSGLLAKSEGPAGRDYSCRPEAAATLAALAEAHERDRAAIMQLMTTNALNRVRTSALRAFSSAFLLGRKRDG